MSTASAHRRAPPLSLLLRPRWQGLRNAWRRASPSRRLTYAFFGALTLGFWFAVLAICIFLLRMANGVELVGPLLLRKALSMLFMAFSGMLLFSNIITALSSYFLSDDMQLVQALPITGRRTFYYRAIDTALNSSWMIVIFGLPVLLAFGIVHDGGPLFYLVALAGLVAYLVPPVALGIAIAVLLVRGFSASRIREVMALVSGVFLVVILLLLRALRPERLVDPEAFATLAEFIAAVRTPDAAWLPSTWLTELSMWALGNPLDSPWLTASLLFVGGPSLLVLVRWLVAPLWFDAWTRAQEAPRKAASRSVLVARLVDGITRPLPQPYRALLRKDLRLFLREPGQWTQALLLTGLVAIYVYVLYVLGTESIPEDFRNIIIFLNVGMAGSVLSAIAVRFNFTAVSQEGRAFWILHASPVGARRFLYGKYIMAFGPTLLLGETLVVGTNLVLGVTPLYAWISAATIFMLAVGLTGLSVGMGALFPDFKADNAARVAAGPGAILFMVLALSFTAVVIVAEAVPVGILYYRQIQGEPIGLGLGVALAVVAISIVAANLFAAIVPLHRGAAKLWGDLGNVGD